MTASWRWSAAILLFVGATAAAILPHAVAQPPQAPPAAKDDPVSKLTPDDIANGKKIFAAQCAACHGFDGSGQLGPDLHGVEGRRGDAGIFGVVRNGAGAGAPGAGAGAEP